MLQTELLIVGAGPFGLAMAAQAQALGIDHLVLGEPMSFWREHMPLSMIRRLACDWSDCHQPGRFAGQRVPMLAAGIRLALIETRDGFLVLDTSLQTSVPGLYLTHFPAARDFGLFFAFTASVRTSAHIIGRALQARAA